MLNVHEVATVRGILLLCSDLCPYTKQVYISKAVNMDWNTNHEEHNCSVQPQVTYGLVCK
jgi:hypothetical protein